eukprot:514629-Prorocentrum_minimum.AAC.2
MPVHKHPKRVASALWPPADIRAHELHGWLANESFLRPTCTRRCLPTCSPTHTSCFFPCSTASVLLQVASSSMALRAAKTREAARLMLGSLPPNPSFFRQ